MNHGPGSQAATLKLELRDMAQRMRGLEETLDKASNFVVELSAYVSKFPTAPAGSRAGSVPPEEFWAFKEAHAQSPASICQELKGGALRLEGSF